MVPKTTPKGDGHADVEQPAEHSLAKADRVRVAGPRYEEVEQEQGGDQADGRGQPANVTSRIDSAPRPGDQHRRIGVVHEP